VVRSQHIIFRNVEQPATFQFGVHHKQEIECGKNCIILSSLVKKGKQKKNRANFIEVVVNVGGEKSLCGTANSRAENISFSSFFLLFLTLWETIN
jgi:hypothetical protein